MLNAYVTFNNPNFGPDSIDQASQIGYNIGPLELVEIISRRSGFDDVDVEPFDDCIRITCRSKTGDRKINAKGRNMEESCQNLLKVLMP